VPRSDSAAEEAAATAAAAVLALVIPPVVAASLRLEPFAESVNEENVDTAAEEKDEEEVVELEPLELEAPMLLVAFRAMPCIHWGRAEF